MIKSSKKNEEKQLVDIDYCIELLRIEQIRTFIHELLPVISIICPLVIP